MQKISEAIRPSHQERLKEIKENILGHNAVKHFIQKQGDLITDEVLENSWSRLNEYIVNLSNPNYEPILFMQNGYIDVMMKPRPETAMLEAKYQQGVLTSLSYSDSTRALSGLTLDDVSTEVYNIAALSFVKEFLQKYSYGNRSNALGMWLCGNRGVGKSYLMGALAGELGKKKVGVKFVGMGEMLNEIQDKWSNFSFSQKKAIESYQKPEVLILDDIGVEQMTAWRIDEMVFPILNYRMQNKLPTFFTSNYTKDEYQDMIVKTGKSMTVDKGKHFRSRVDSLAREVQLNGPDRRRKA